MSANGLLKQARRAARLSQRDLAGRTGIDQAVIGRIEAGTSSPRFDTLERLLHATGHGLAVVVEPVPDVDRSDIRAALALDDGVRERSYIESNANMLRMFDEARRRP